MAGIYGQSEPQWSHDFYTSWIKAAFVVNVLLCVTACHFPSNNVLTPHYFKVVWMNTQYNHEWNPQSQEVNLWVRFHSVFVYVCFVRTDPLGGTIAANKM